MAYVKTQNGQVQKFPYTMGDFRRDNPNTSFPKLISQEILASYGVFEVLVDTSPAVDEKNYKAIRADVPTYANNEWRLEWSVVAKSEEEKQKYYDGVAQSVRSKRDNLLASCDWMAIKAFESGSTVSADWATYRQALRDVTAQAGFPHEITWPTKPE